MYEQRDVSAGTSLLVGASRTILAAGALIHTVEGQNPLPWLQAGSAEAGTPASADYIIERNGLRYSLTRPGRYAFHAGVSEVLYKNRLYRNTEVSQLLIGIELARFGSQHITREQYASLAELLRERALTLGWSGDYPIYGHYAVARPLGRRSDPVNFDWGVLRAMLL